MIIYNTTYQIESSVLNDTLSWMRSSLIPSIVADGTLSNPRMLRVIVDEAEMGHCYSLQFDVLDEDTLLDWFESAGNELLSAISKRYGQKVLGFTTLLEVLEL